mgnify:CR=1 FL=1
MSLVDPSQGRLHRKLRISVTDRCAFQCSYCVPDAPPPALERRELLTFEEIVDFVRRVAVPHGLTRLRLTGGEPLQRRDLPELVGRLHALEGVTSIGLTTNGERLDAQGDALFEAGVTSLNVSLDTLRADHLGCYGYGRGTSPFIDSLAAGGVLFEQARSHGPKTAWSLPSLVTGRFFTELERTASKWPRVRAPGEHLGERLAAAGYHTVGVAPVFYFFKRYGLAAGFQEWDTSVVQLRRPFHQHVSGDLVTEKAIKALRDDYALPLDEIRRLVNLSDIDEDITLAALPLPPRLEETDTSTALDFIRARQAQGYQQRRVRQQPQDTESLPEVSAHMMQSPDLSHSMPDEEPPSEGSKTSTGPIELLLQHLQSLTGDQRVSRRARGEEWFRLSVTPDLEFHVRGELTREQIRLFEQLADHFRHILLGGK